MKFNEYNQWMIEDDAFFDKLKEKIPGLKRANEPLFPRDTSEELHDSDEVLSCTTRQLDFSFPIEKVRDMKTLHNISEEDFLYDLLVEGIKEELIVSNSNLDYFYQGPG